MDAIGDFFSSVDIRIWWLVAVAVATILTLQAVETAVEGAWPHQRRPGQTPMAARGGNRVWAIAGLLLLVALLLTLLNLAIVAWKDLDLDNPQIVGASLVAVAWLLFIGGTSTRLGIGRYLRGLGAAGPATIAILLLAGGVLLLVTFLDILPPWDEIRDALPF